ncbi:Plasmodium exported protein (PHIST), unknown function [Plasmodium sp. gorilla clade G2]|uniref:Plasmodium exported protein (PHIST), unknown function n=1 Tax=Plasmodium sp. gorilla clade G2 TaxID=880535 RepID=UPI000D201F56|nr:Plasmodium exported protein (PHIST), unknown function [Plasmodium sp. gorilla clade G2]SOV11122.1 Plasmodium exported protein (PHIST), unknown function [Plasmodium sp. gorilla clade G2]
MNKKSGSLSGLYVLDKNEKGILRYISFKFLCLSLYIIGFYYVFLNTSLENKGLHIVNISNMYERNLGEAQKNRNGSQRKRNLKLKNEDVSKTKYNTNNIKSNEQSVEENKNCNNNDMKNNNVQNKSNSSVNNINYNDLSKNLTEKELYNVLNSLKECPSKEDLRNIWTHTLGVAKEGLDDIYQQLKASIQKYLDNEVCLGTDEFSDKIFVYKDMWNEQISRFCQSVGNEQGEYTNKFFSLINDKHTLDDILKFIYSFLEYFHTIKNELHEKHQKELLESIAKTLNKKK